jgi:flagellar biosynthesis/type III secretory pathway protein FliH
MRNFDGVTTEVFEYPASGKTPRSFWEDLSESGRSGSHSAQVPFNTKDKGDLGIEEEERQSFDLGRETGIREGRRQEQEAQKDRIIDVEKEMKERYIAKAAELTEQFTQKQVHLFEGLEQEIVHLVTAIAERVLRREAQTDPLFLVGAVRVALSQLAQTTHVSLQVPAADAKVWSETMSHLPNLKVRPQIVPNAAMQPGECLIESEMGSVDLGMATQLDVIRRSMLDDHSESGSPQDQGRQSKSEEIRT